MNLTLEQIEDDQEAEEEFFLERDPDYGYEADGGETDPEAGEGGKRRKIISTAAEYPIFNRETGEMSMIIFDAARARLAQKFPLDYPNKKFAGKRVYTSKKSDAPKPVRGTLACPMSNVGFGEEARELGFNTPSCNKPAYFMSEYDVDLHVEKSHKRFYRIRNEQRWRKEQRGRDDRQDRILQALIDSRTSSQMPFAGVSVGDRVVEETVSVSSPSLSCECGWMTKPDSKNPVASLNTHKRLHCKLNKE